MVAILKFYLHLNKLFNVRCVHHSTRYTGSPPSYEWGVCIYYCKDYTKNRQYLSTNVAKSVSESFV